MSSDWTPQVPEELAGREGIVLTPAELKTLFPGGAEEVLSRLAGAPEFERNEQ